MADSSAFTSSPLQAGLAGSRAARLAAGLVLAAMALVSLVRSVDLAREGWKPSAEGERRWFGWAYGGAELVRRLESLGAEVEPGRAVYLVVPEGGRWQGWYPVMARYYLPYNPIAGAGGTVEAPEGAQVLVLDPAGPAEPGGED